MRVVPLPSSAATAAHCAARGPSPAGAAHACALGQSSLTGRAAAVLAVVLLAAGLAGCEAPPPRHPPYRARVAPAPAPAPEVVTEVIAYPSQGQSEQQLDRDRYECHQWAVKQTGFDPSLPGVPPRQQVRVVRAPAGPPPGAAIAGGAVTGAVLGAAVSRPRDAGAGALVGAVAGAAVGAAVEQSARTEEQRREEEVVTERQSARSSARDEQAGAYRRAISACLEGRGYSVR